MLLLITSMTLCLVLMDTQLFRAGFTSLLLRAFGRTFAVIILYFALSVGLFVFNLVRGNRQPQWSLSS